MIVSAHLNDCILMAADKRALLCDLDTGELSLSHDAKDKINLWTKGAIAGTGENIFLTRITEYFKNIPCDALEINHMDMIQGHLIKRMLEGIPEEILKRNTIIFSMFNNRETLLYSIDSAPFFNCSEDDEQAFIEVEIQPTPPWQVLINVYNLPPDMSMFQNFQRNLKSMADFDQPNDFFNYYIQQLKIIFSTHALVDPSITPSFDLYFQSCTTGNKVIFNVESESLPMKIPDHFNYWDKHPNRLMKNE